MKYLNVFLLLLFGCVSYNENEYGENENNYIKQNETVLLSLAGEVVFNLDSLTAHIYNASQYIYDEGAYSILSNTNDILIFDYQTRKCIRKIPVCIERASSYEYLNKDTILIADYLSNSVHFINELGNDYKTVKIEKDILYYPFPLTRTSPIIIDEGKLFVVGHIAGEYENENVNNRQVVSVIDLAMTKTSSYIPYPDVYRENWGGGLFRWVYGDYNYSKKTLVLSFPADHNIYEYNNDLLLIGKYYAGSSYIDATEYLKNPKNEYISSDLRTKHFVETHSYSCVYFDKFNKVYYRFSELKAEYTGVPIWEKELTIIILDEEFNIIGESYIGALPSQYREAVFINEEGLHLPKKESDENALLFDIYKLVRI